MKLRSMLYILQRGGIIHERVDAVDGQSDLHSSLSKSSVDRMDVMCVEGGEGRGCCYQPADAGVGGAGGGGGGWGDAQA
ncbi:Protein of unknown function [Gryllus bimaculatus]|nr:Protein of unknown function [Gryllus bimaculatus]